MKTTTLIIARLSVLGILFICLTFNVKAQNYFNGTTYTINLGCNTLDYGGIEFTNDNPYPLILKWTKVLEDTVSGSRFDICANAGCYIGVPDTGSNRDFPVPPYEIGFYKMHYWTGDSSGTSTVKIYVYEESSPNDGDTLTYFLNISCSGVGIEESNKGINNLSIYPNPSKGVVSISLEEATNASLTLRNSFGQILLTDKYNSTRHIDLNLNVPVGIYFLQIEANGEIITRKIVKK